MKKVLLTIAMIISTVVAFAQNAVDGNWKGSRETPNGVMEVNYSFKAEGNKLTGIWKNQREENQPSKKELLMAKKSRLLFLSVNVK